MYTEWEDESQVKTTYAEEVEPSCDIWDIVPEVSSDYDICTEEPVAETTTPWLTKAGDEWVGLDADPWVAKV